MGNTQVQHVTFDPLQERNQESLPRHAVTCATLALLSAALSWQSVRALLQLALANDAYTHVLLILPIVACLVYADRHAIVQQVGYCIPGGFTILAVGGLVCMLSFANSMQDGCPWAGITGLFVLLIGSFVLSFGAQAARAAAFPLIFMTLMIPLPIAVTEKLIYILQQASVATAYWLLRLATIPIFRDGILLTIPGINVSVQAECSGIRSTLMLFITSLVFGRVFLHSIWARTLLTLLVIPLAIAKNGFRIFTLCILALRFGGDVFGSSLHRNGGIPVFVASIAVLLIIISCLRKLETLSAAIWQS